LKTLLHLSDLHFGRVDVSVVEPLIAVARKLRPDLVVISGDFTQRARPVEFRAARAFLRELPQPQLVVPGNHDVPLWDIWRRFVSPLTRYRRYICAELAPFYEDAEIAVLGINTVRSLTRKYGRINERQIAAAQAIFAGVRAEAVRIVVTHHPFDLPPGLRSHSIVGRSVMAMEGLATAGVDLILSGHLHLQHVGLTARRYPIAGHCALIAQAGTTISTRGRGESNSFNLVRVEHSTIRFDHYLWQRTARDFRCALTERFVRVGGLWERAAIEEGKKHSTGDRG
jgi:3',5'-cyclic AMP phosphodiesterase CpdA